MKIVVLLFVVACAYTSHTEKRNAITVHLVSESGDRNSDVHYALPVDVIAGHILHRRSTVDLQSEEPDILPKRKTFRKRYFRQNRQNVYAL